MPPNCAGSTHRSGDEFDDLIAELDPNTGRIGRPGPGLPQRLPGRRPRHGALIAEVSDGGLHEADRCRGRRQRGIQGLGRDALAAPRRYPQARL